MLLLLAAENSDEIGEKDDEADATEKGQEN
jgi:hypothetical protein